MQKIKNNESGRSMVEMLGVLAIIGVLSVGGLAGYTVAVRKNRANEVARIISLMGVEATTADNGEGTCLLLSGLNWIAKPTYVADIAFLAPMTVSVQFSSEVSNAIALCADIDRLISNTDIQMLVCGSSDVSCDP